MPILPLLGLLLGTVTTLAVILARRATARTRAPALPSPAPRSPTLPSPAPIPAAQPTLRPAAPILPAVLTGPGGAAAPSRTASGSVAPPINRRRLPGLAPTNAYALVPAPVPSGRIRVPPKMMDFSDDE